MARWWSRTHPSLEVARDSDLPPGVPATASQSGPPASRRRLRSAPRRPRPARRRSSPVRVRGGARMVGDSGQQPAHRRRRHDLPAAPPRQPRGWAAAWRRHRGGTAPRSARRDACGVPHLATGTRARALAAWAHLQRFALLDLSRRAVPAAGGAGQGDTVPCAGLAAGGATPARAASGRRGCRPCPRGRRDPDRSRRPPAGPRHRDGVRRDRGRCPRRVRRLVRLAAGAGARRRGCRRRGPPARRARGLPGGAFRRVRRSDARPERRWLQHQPGADRDRRRRA